jgi:hypothetical protein
VRLVIQAAVDAEVAEFLGRDRYARAGATVLGIATVTPSFGSVPPPGSGVGAAQALRHGPPCFLRLLGKCVSRTMRWRRWCWRGSCVAYRS